jgi:5'-nucleotidase
MRTLRFAIVALFVCCLASPFQAQAPYRILLSNDDGVRSPGLQAVAEALRSLGEVTIVAPADNQSAKGTSLTINDPIVQENLTLPSGMAAIGLTATPATTVKVALTKILTSPPNLVVSGINRGTNMGLAAYISGTVGAAREAAARGIPAIASSLSYAAAGDLASYKAAAEATLRVATIVKAQGLPKGVLLNVNVPAGTMQTFKGIRVTTQGTATGGDESFDARVHPTSKRTYYWNVFIEGGKDVEGTDTWAVENGYVAVTPLKVGEFDQSSFDTLKTIIK